MCTVVSIDLRDRTDDAFKVRQHDLKKSLRFRRKQETSHIDCGLALRNDQTYIKSLKAERLTLPDRELPMSCEDIRKRVIAPSTHDELPSGVAHARIVYESYEFLEDELRSSYHPQNVFCYAIDAKAKREFSVKIEKLAKCLTNVVVAKDRFNISRRGANMTRAHLACMKSLLGYQGWSYVLLMQNYDVMIKTVYEAAAITKVLEGANDVHVRPCESGRYNHSAKWDARSLKLFKNEKLASPTQLAASLTFARGAVHAALSRDAVNWMLNVIDLRKTIAQLDIDVTGVDEVLIPTLQVSDELDMPGRFTSVCIKKRHVIGFVTRVEHWIYDKQKCQSGHYRNSVCVYGIDDFYWLAKHPKLMANKMMPDFDYAIVDCIHELLFNRTHLEQVNDSFDLDKYSKQPYVQFHKNRLNPDPNFQLDCSYGL